MRASLARILAVCLKELVQLSRDRVTFGMVVMMPLVMLLLFGYAINTDVRHVPTALVDNAHTAFSRQFAQDLQATQVLRFVRNVASTSELDALIRRGEVMAGVVIPADVEQRYYSGQPPVAQVVVDGSDTMVAMAVNNLRAFPFSVETPATNSLEQSNLSVRLLYNPERRSAVFIVPGLTAIILTLTMILFTAIALVRERESGSFELLVASPVNNLELMAGKIIPYVFIGLIQVAIILSVGDLLFDVPVVQPLQILVASLCFIVACLTLGLAISAIAPSQLGAMQIFMFIMLPSILMSGFVFPFVAMPEVFQQISEILPATHFLRVVRALILRHATLVDVADDLAYLLGFALVMLVLASLLFRRRLD